MKVFFNVLLYQVIFIYLIIFFALLLFKICRQTTNISDEESTINMIFCVEVLGLLIYVIVLFIYVYTNHSFYITFAIIPYLCSMYCYCSLEPNEDQVDFIENHANPLI